MSRYYVTSLNNAVVFKKNSYSNIRIPSISAYLLWKLGKNDKDTFFLSTIRKIVDG